MARDLEAFFKRIEEPKPPDPCMNIRELFMQEQGLVTTTTTIPYSVYSPFLQNVIASPEGQLTHLLFPNAHW